RSRLCAGALAALMLLPLFLLSGCEKQKKKEEDDGDDPAGPQIVEVRLNTGNFYDYFDYKEYPSYATDEDGNINACNLSYGFALREGYQAANDPDHKDSLRVSFTAEGVSQNGEYTVDFQTLQYSGTTWSEERETISDTLSFWPQGNRTVSYPYGTISSSYIITFRSMNITAVSGSIFLMARAAVS
ncbi:MAG: hypothetical protein J6U19_00650, partial [Oscillospiraceae bacterium]|nr:hypothetical protein [Oscillospiraceae bacterium]